MLSAAESTDIADSELISSSVILLPLLVETFRHSNLSLMSVFSLAFIRFDLSTAPADKERDVCGLKVLSIQNKSYLLLLQLITELKLELFNSK